MCSPSAQVNAVSKFIPNLPPPPMYVVFKIVSLSPETTFVTNFGLQM